jgi:N-acetylglutamate synthase-like GNAT family acetyltransferase
MNRTRDGSGEVAAIHKNPSVQQATKAVAVWALPFEDADDLRLLAQSRSSDYVAVVVRRLWQRGAYGDMRALEMMLAANPNTPRLDALCGPLETTLHPWVDAKALPEILPLLRNEYWNISRLDDDAILREHHKSQAWVVARDASGAIIGTARSISEGSHFSYLADVAIHVHWRRRGIGRALIQLLLAHPSVRHAQRVELTTRDAVDFYKSFGFSVISTEPNPTGLRHHMQWIRTSNPLPGALDGRDTFSF